MKTNLYLAEFEKTADQEMVESPTKISDIGKQNLKINKEATFFPFNYTQDREEDPQWHTLKLCLNR